MSEQQEQCPGVFSKQEHLGGNAAAASGYGFSWVNKNLTRNLKGNLGEMRGPQETLKSSDVFLGHKR